MINRFPSNKLSTYSAYFKAKNMIFFGINKTEISNLEQKITNQFLYDIDPTFNITNIFNNNDGIDNLIDILYPSDCVPYNINFNKDGIPNQIHNLNIINKIITFYQELQMKFNYKSLKKCSSPILYKYYFDDTSIIGSNKLSGDKSHDLYVYIHSGIFGNEVFFSRLFKIACKIQKYIYENYKWRNCSNKIL